MKLAELQQLKSVGDTNASRSKGYRTRAEGDLLLAEYETTTLTDEEFNTKHTLEKSYMAKLKSSRLVEFHAKITEIVARMQYRTTYVEGNTVYIAPDGDKTRYNPIKKDSQLYPLIKKFNVSIVWCDNPTVSIDHHIVHIKSKAHLSAAIVEVIALSRGKI